MDAQPTRNLSRMKSNIVETRKYSTLMDTALILDKIKTLADTLYEDGSTFTRSDLAWELQEDLAKVGITGDSLDISRLVWECYQNTKDEAVAKSFVTNSRSFTLVEEHTIPALVEAGDTENVFGTVSKKLVKSDDILGQLKSLVDNGINLSLVDATTSSVS